jgi:drug/metabolite transporter (DMT)-like permease
LGLKILLLAAVATAGSHWPGLRRALPLDPITSWQWLAVVASVLAAFVLNRAGGRMAAAGFACILFTCLTYSLSDVSIGILVERVRPMGRLRGPMYGCCLSYLLTGAVGLAALAWRPVPAASKWWLAFPVAVSWLLGMLFLYVSFRLIGVLFGNIMQSTRGLISIGLGALVAGRSMHHLEARVDPGVFWRRVGAAVLMLAAVTVFLLGRTP